MKPSTTWIGHTLVALAVGLAVAIVTELAYLKGYADISMALGTSLAAVYFGLIREKINKLEHQILGDYDEPGDENVTPRIDRIGDMLGPIALAVGSVVTMIAGRLS